MRYDSPALRLSAHGLASAGAGDARGPTAAASLQSWCDCFLFGRQHYSQLSRVMLPCDGAISGSLELSFRKNLRCWKLQDRFCARAWPRNQLIP